MPTFEESISSSAGWGLYNTATFTMCGFCYMAEGSLAAALSTILPISAAEVTSNQKSMAAYLSMHTAGMAVGGVIGGMALDATGRRCVVPLALMIAFTGTTVWAFAGNTEFIYTGMLFLGMGLGMHSMALRVYLSETLRPSSRGACMALLSIFWAVGFFCAAALQLLLEPLAEDDPIGFRPTSWRVVVSLSACFTAVVACTCGALGPSTRWLLAQGRVGAVVDHLRRVYSINKSRHADTFQVPRLRGLITEIPSSWRIREDSVLCTFMLTRMGRQIGECFKKPYVYLTLLSMFVRLPILNGMWTDMPWMMPLLRYPCQPDYEPTKLNSLEKVHGAMRLQTEVYQNVMILAAIIIIFATLLYFVIDFFGHRLTLFIFLGAATSALLCIALPISVIPVEVVCCLFFGSLINAEITFAVMSAEMYPTHIRGTANGLIPVLGRCTSIFVHTHLQFIGYCLPVTYGLLAACGLGMLLVWALPEYSKKPMRELAAPALLGRDSEVGAGETGARPRAGAGTAPALFRDGHDEAGRRMEHVFDMDDFERNVNLRNVASAPEALHALPEEPAPNPRGRIRYPISGSAARNAMTAVSVAQPERQETQRRVKTIKIVDNSHKTLPSGSYYTEPVELIIISDVPICSAKLFTTMPEKYSTKCEGSTNAVCHRDLPSSETDSGTSPDCPMTFMDQKYPNKLTERLGGAGEPRIRSHTYQKIKFARPEVSTYILKDRLSQTVKEIHPPKNRKTKVERSESKTDRPTHSSGGKGMKSKYPDPLSKMKGKLSQISDRNRTSWETLTSSENLNDWDSINVNCSSNDFS